MYLISDRPGEGAIILRGLRVFMTQEEVVEACALKLIADWEYWEKTNQRKVLLGDCFDWDGPKIFEVFSDKNPKKMNKEVTRPLVLTKAKEILKKREQTNVPSV